MNRLLPSPADGKLLLASASQAKNVRVWAVSQQQEQQEPGQPRSSANGGAVAASLAASLTRYAPRPLIRAGQHTYAATLEAVLIGHEDWVHSVAWHPRVQQPDGSGSSQPPCLLSASMDRTMMLWRPDQATGAHHLPAAAPLSQLDVPIQRLYMMLAACRLVAKPACQPCHALFEAACASPPLRMLSKSALEHRSRRPAGHLRAAVPVIRWGSHPWSSP